MTVPFAAGFALLFLLAGGITWWLLREQLRHLGRRRGIGRTLGVAGYLAWVAGLALPVALGATDFDAWPVLVGATAYTGGVVLLVDAAANADEFAMVRAAERLAPGDVDPGIEEPVLVTGTAVPTVDRDAPVNADFDGPTTPFTGRPTAHTDWTLQERRSLGYRGRWENVGMGTEPTRFYLRGPRTAVLVDTDGGRIGSGERSMTVVEADETFPEAGQAFLRKRDDLPMPDEIDEDYRYIERFVPAADQVTVLGYASDSPGRLPDTAAGGDRPSGVTTLVAGHDADGDAGDPDFLVAAGSVDGVRSSLRRNVILGGAVGGVLLVGGELAMVLLGGVPVPVLG